MSSRVVGSAARRLPRPNSSYNSAPNVGSTRWAPREDGDTRSAPRQNFTRDQRAGPSSRGPYKAPSSGNTGYDRRPTAVRRDSRPHDGPAAHRNGAGERRHAPLHQNFRNNSHFESVSPRPSYSGRHGAGGATGTSQYRSSSPSGNYGGRGGGDTRNPNFRPPSPAHNYGGRPSAPGDGRAPRWQSAPEQKSRPPISPGDLKALNKLTTRTIKAAGEGSKWPGWKRSSQSAEDEALWRETSRPTTLPSEKKEKFSANAGIEDDKVLASLYGDSEDTYIQPGSFLELRRNQIITLAVLLRDTVVDLRPTKLSLTASGETFEHEVGDVMWVGPEFISKSDVEQCGPGLTPETPSQHAARVQVVRQLREFERAFERVQSGFASKFGKLYDEVRNADPDEWAEVKTADVAVKLKDGNTPSATDVLAAHRLLMEDSAHYIAHPRAHRVAQTFLVRPLNDVQQQQKVLTWFREHENKQIQSFADKAAQLLLHKHDTSAAHPPTPLQLDLPAFDENDKAIIFYLRQAAMARRSVQRDITLAHSMRLLKMVGFYELGKALNYNDVFAFLKAIGVVAPWDDEAWTVPHMHMLSKEPPGSTAREKRHAELAARLPQPSSPLSLTPPSDEFYPRDIVEPLRRDFGDTPVYVIDDPEAKELDDGISIERISGSPNEFWLHVHIADPTTYLHPEHDLSRFAREMSTTVYARHRTWPMLPNALTIGRFSLGAVLRDDWPKDQPMETMTFSARVNTDGQILETKVTPAYIRRPVITSYDSVDRALGPPHRETIYPFAFAAEPKKEHPPALTESAEQDLKLIEQLSTKLRHQRMKGTAFFWQLEKPDVFLPSEKSGGLPIRPYIPDEPVFYSGSPAVTYGVLGIQAGRAQMLVTECMVLGARVASRVATELKVPVLRRTAPPPQVQPEFRDAFQKLLATRDSDGRVDTHDVLKCSILIHSGSYTLRPAEHAMLGIEDGEGYGRATSPLRRYIDILTHWQLKSGLLRQAGMETPPLLTPRALKELGAQLGAREYESSRLMTENERFWAVECVQRAITANEAEGKGPMIFDSIAMASSQLNLRTRDFFVVVHVPKLGLWVRVEGIPGNEFIDIGDRVQIVLTGTRGGPATVLARRADKSELSS